MAELVEVGIDLRIVEEGAAGLELAYAARTDTVGLVVGQGLLRGVAEIRQGDRRKAVGGKRGGQQHGRQAAQCGETGHCSSGFVSWRILAMDDVKLGQFGVKAGKER